MLCWQARWSYTLTYWKQWFSRVISMCLQTFNFPDHILLAHQCVQDWEHWTQHLSMFSSYGGGSRPYWNLVITEVIKLFSAWESKWKEIKTTCKEHHTNTPSKFLYFSLTVRYELNFRPLLCLSRSQTSGIYLYTLCFFV